MDKEQALIILKELHKDALFSVRTALETLIPEIKEESEDEIRKELVEHCKNQAKPYIDTGNECPQIQSWISYLEKQGEQKAVTKVEPKFHEGEWVVNPLGEVWHIDSLDKKNYQVSNTIGKHSYFLISKQDKMHLWSIKDAKDGDVLALSYASQNYIFIYKGLYEKGFKTMMSVFCFCCVEKDTYYDETDSFHVLNHGEIITPATKERRDILFQKMHEAGYKWNEKEKAIMPLKVKSEETDGELN